MCASLYDREKVKYKYLKVVSTSIYLVEMTDDNCTNVNGWTPEKVVEEWFNRFSLNQFHISRENAKIGNASQVQDVEILDDIGEYMDGLKLEGIRKQGRQFNERKRVF